LSKLFFLETNAVDFALGAVLTQYGNDNYLHPIAFYSRKKLAATLNYERALSLTTMICDKTSLNFVGMKAQ
jgi:hypothetical protein